METVDSRDSDTLNDDTTGLESKNRAVKGGHAVFRGALDRQLLAALGARSCIPGPPWASALPGRAGSLLLLGSWLLGSGARVAARAAHHRGPGEPLSLPGSWTPELRCWGPFDPGLLPCRLGPLSKRLGARSCSGAAAPGVLQVMALSEAPGSLPVPPACGAAALRPKSPLESSGAEAAVVMDDPEVGDADRRLMKVGRELGLINDERWCRFEQKMAAIEGSMAMLAQKVSPTLDMVEKFANNGLGELKKQSTVEQLLRRPEYSYELLSRVVDLPTLSAEEAEQVETDIKYAGYLKRERVRAEQAKKMAGVSLDGVNFAEVAGLSSEVIQRLFHASPATLDAASRVPSVTPAAITALALYMSRLTTASKKQSI